MENQREIAFNSKLFFILTKYQVLTLFLSCHSDLETRTHLKVKTILFRSVAVETRTQLETLQPSPGP